MLLLNIFQHYDGSTAWDNIIILALAVLAGYLLQRFNANNRVVNKYGALVASWEKKYKTLDSEFKGYKASIASADKSIQKSAAESISRVKSLEGDIRALSEEKQKYVHQLHSKEQELKQYSLQVADLEDALKALRESQQQSALSWAEKLKSSKAALDKATAWEHKVRSAEQDMLQARAGLQQAERGRLEAELRLKATTAYAGKVGTLEKEIETLRAADGSRQQELEANKIRMTAMETELQERIAATDELQARLHMCMAQLELQKANQAILRDELEAKKSEQVSLKAELEYLKNNVASIREKREDGVPSLKAPYSLP